MTFMASLNALISGFSACIILITGWSAGIGCIIRSKQDKTPLLLWAGFFLACMGTFYLGTVASWFFLILKGSNLPEVLVGRMCYTVTPVGISMAMYVGFSIIRPKLAKFMALIYIITAPIFWYGLYMEPALTISSSIPDEVGGGLIDINLLSYVKTLVTVYLLSFGLILITGFSWLAKKSTGVIRKKAIFHCIGYLLFVGCGAIDSMVPFSSWIVIVRIVMAAAYIFLYFGFTKMG